MAAMRCFPSSSPTRSAGSGEAQQVFDSMDYNVDTQSWVLAEALKDHTCQHTTQHLIERVTPVSYACRNFRSCPRCASQKHIDDQYEDPEMYKDQSVYIMQALEAFLRNTFGVPRRGVVGCPDKPG